MIKVLFFARLREQLEVDGLDVDAAAVNTVAQLVDQLIQENGQRFEALRADNVVCAVNQTVATSAAALTTGDEVAFYPPVSGG